MDIALAEDADLPPDVLTRLQPVPPISIYRLLAIVPQSLIPWTDLVGAIYECELDDRLREIAICRQARSARARYELHQHRQIAPHRGQRPPQRFTNATRAPVEEDNPLADASNPSVG
jgi:alkylhydroperoxidase family enzyme